MEFMVTTSSFFFASSPFNINAKMSKIRLRGGPKVYTHIHGGEQVNIHPQRVPLIKFLTPSSWFEKGKIFQEVKRKLG